MKRLFLLFSLLFAVVAMNAQELFVSSANLFISEVADPGDHYQGRFIELYNPTSSSIDLGAGNYNIVKQVNGGTYYATALTGIIPAGGTFTIANQTDFNTYYGFDPDFNTTNISGNGDDGYYLYAGGDNTTGTLVDAYGVPDEDGTGKPWVYENSHAVRNAGIVSPSIVWTESEWTITSADVTDMTPGVHHTSSGNAATQLIVSSVTPSDPEKDEAFALTVVSFDGGGVVADVASNETVTLSLTTGTGTLSGTLSGIITTATNSVSFPGLSYDVGESIVITTTGSSLTSTTVNITITEILPAVITGAVYIPASGADPAGIGVAFDKDASALTVSDFTLNGSAVFSNVIPVSTDAVIDTLFLTGATITNDLTLDVLAETVGNSNTSFYAGIVPFSAINSASAPDTILSGYNATFTGIITTSNDFDKAWIQDANGAKNGAMIYNAAFSKSHVAGDSVVFAAQKAISHGGNQLLLSLEFYKESGKTPVVTPVKASDIYATLDLGTESAEKWVGQLVSISGITAGTIDGNYAYTCFYAGDTVVVEDLVDYHFGSGFVMTEGTAYNVTGVVAWYYDMFRIAPRGVSDLLVGTPVDENSGNVNINVYPNPAVNTLRFTGEISNVVLFNAMGQKMNVLFENNIMNVSNIATGVYSARITMKNGDVLNKQIIKK